MNKFDWVRFHKDLDMALAIYITEADGSIHHEFIKFLEFSNNKQLAPTSAELPTIRETWLRIKMSKIEQERKGR